MAKKSKQRPFRVDTADLSNRRFGRLIAVKLAERNKPGERPHWHCECDCGNKTRVSANALVQELTKSCGCYNRLADRSKNNFIHGYATDGRSKPEFKLYRVWSEMIQRCHNPNNKRYEYYGARGITVCDRWRESKTGFTNFLADMGPRPEGYWIERDDNEKGYCPDNCSWKSRQGQQRNSRNNSLVTYKGKTQCVIEWAEELDIPVKVLYTRFQRGWSPERAFTQPVRASSRST